MFTVIQSLGRLSFESICTVYSQSLQEQAVEHYPFLEKSVQQVEARQDFYSFLSDFLKQDDCLLMLWSVEGRYTCALRTEPYRGGFLLTGLETAPGDRRKGYARMLLQHTLSYLQENCSGTVYSHVRKNNLPSMNAHLSVGFTITKDLARLLDGSVDTSYYTLSYKL